MEKKTFPWAMLAIAFAAERGYDKATPEEREAIVEEFLDFMESKL